MRKTLLCCLCRWWLADLLLTKYGCASVKDSHLIFQSNGVTFLWQDSLQISFIFFTYNNIIAGFWRKSTIINKLGSTHYFFKSIFYTIFMVYQNAILKKNKWLYRSFFNIIHDIMLV